MEWTVNMFIPLVLSPGYSKFDPPVFEGGPRQLLHYLGKRKYYVIF